MRIIVLLTVSLFIFEFLDHRYIWPFLQRSIPQAAPVILPLIYALGGGLVGVGIRLWSSKGGTQRDGRV